MLSRICLEQNRQTQNWIGMLRSAGTRGGRLLGRFVRSSAAPSPHLADTVAASEILAPPFVAPVHLGGLGSQLSCIDQAQGWWSTTTHIAHRGYAAKKKGKKRDKREKDEPEAVAANVEDVEEEVDDDVDVLEASEFERDACFESLSLDFASIRPNRATPGMLDHILVSAYDDKMPLKHLASSNVRDVSTLVVSVFDPQVAQSVEKAILGSPLGLNPISDGQEIVVRVPTPTDESRQQMCKIVRSQAEKAKVRLRKARQKAMQRVKALVSDKDERKGLEKEVEKFFDDAVSAVQDQCAAKENEVMS